MTMSLCSWLLCSDSFGEGGSEKFEVKVYEKVIIVIIGVVVLIIYVLWPLAEQVCGDGGDCNDVTRLGNVPCVDIMYYTNASKGGKSEPWISTNKRVPAYSGGDTYRTGTSQRTPATCQQYLNFKYCNLCKEKGPSWDSDWGEFNDYKTRIADGRYLDATQACCACGGGSSPTYTLPAPNKGICEACMEEAGTGCSVLVLLLLCCSPVLLCCVAIALKKASEQASGRAKAKAKAPKQAEALALRGPNFKAKALARMRAETEASKLARAKSDMELHMTKWDTRSAPSAPQLQVGGRSGSPAGTIVTIAMQVPPGVGPGQSVKFVAEGQSFAAAVPEGYTPGMTFQATVTLGAQP